MLTQTYDTASGIKGLSTSTNSANATLNGAYDTASGIKGLSTEIHELFSISNTTTYDTASGIKGLSTVTLRSRVVPGL